MSEYILKYIVVIEAEDENSAENLSADIEGEIRFCHHKILEVNCDPYVELME